MTVNNTAPVFDAPSTGTGKVIIDVGNASADNGYNLFLQPDGKILVAGNSYSSNNVTASDFSLIRLNANGTLDTSFSGDGKAIFDIGGSNDHGTGLTVQADGKIIIGGSSYYNNGGADFSLIRLNADGTLDTTFSGDGKAIFDIGGDYDFGSSVTVQADGKIIVAGTSYYGSGASSDFSLIRLNADGTLDTTFSGDGKATFDVGGATDSGESLTLQPDGKIIVAGTSDNSSQTASDFSLIRLNADATLDTSFSGDGKVTFDIGGDVAGYGYSLALQADGKILVAGSTNNGSGTDSFSSDFSVIRLNADGTLDATFSGGGKATVDIGGQDDNARSLTLQADGKILVAGSSYNSDYSSSDFSVIRLNVDGTLDTTFSGDGKAIFDIRGYDSGYSVTVQSDGKILLAGFSDSSTGTSSDFSVIRLNADGTLDTSFASSTLGGRVACTEGAAPIALDASVAIYDADLAALAGGAGNYSGASVTLARHGAASDQDVFSGRGNLSFSGADAVLSGVTVGTLSNAGGVLAITFNANASQDRVNETLSSIGYANHAITPSGTLSVRAQIDWTFSDGGGTQGAALAADGSTTVSIAPRTYQVLYGGTGDDVLVRGAGQDIFLGSAGNDSMDGGAITDRINYTDLNQVIYSASMAAVNVNFSTGIAQDGLGGTDTLVNINYVAGSAYDDILTGSTALIFEQFDGGLGNDTIDGGAVTDTLNQYNNNRVTYLSASSAVQVSLAAHSATGGGGIDTLLNITQVLGSNFNDSLIGSDSPLIEEFNGRAGDDTIDGAGGIDIVRYDGATVAVNVNLATGKASDGFGSTDTLLHIEGIRGSAFGDTLTGGNPANGSAALDGLERFIGMGGNDTIDGGAGYDRVEYTTSTVGVNVTLGGAGIGTARDGLGGTDTLINIEAVRGSAFDDTLIGSDSGAFESFEGREGNDLIDGRGGIDRADYQSSIGAVTVNLASGTAADGYGTTDTLLNIENVRGSTFSDTLTGNAAANILDGGAGNDTLVGGAGADVFYFAANGNGVDTIRDFSDGDVIQVEGLSFTTVPTAGNGAALAQGQIQVLTSGNVTTLSIGSDATPGADVTILLDGIFSVSQLYAHGSDIGFNHAATANFLAYSWKKHALLDGVSISGGSHSAITDAGGAASFTVVTDASLALTASHSVVAAEAAATSGTVNLQDAIAILKMIVGLDVNGAGHALSPYQSLAADFDGNGTVGLSDAIGVLKHVVGLTAPEPTWHFVNEADLSVAGKTGLNPGAAPAVSVVLGSSPVHVGLVGYLTGDVDGSYAGATGALDLDVIAPAYFQHLTVVSGLSMSQFGVYA